MCFAHLTSVSIVLQALNVSRAGSFCAIQQEAARLLQLKARASLSFAIPNPYMVGPFVSSNSRPSRVARHHNLQVAFPTCQMQLRRCLICVQVLYQFHLERCHWQAAASTAYAFAQLLRTEYFKNHEALSASADFVHMAIHLLMQSPPGSRWISCAWQAREEILSSGDLERERRLLQSLSLLRSLGHREADLHPPMIYQALMLKGECFAKEFQYPFTPSQELICAKPIHNHRRPVSGSS